MVVCYRRSQRFESLYYGHDIPFSQIYLGDGQNTIYHNGQESSRVEIQLSKAPTYESLHPACIRKIPMSLCLICLDGIMGAQGRRIHLSVHHSCSPASFIAQGSLYVAHSAHHEHDSRLSKSSGNLNWPASFGYHSGAVSKVIQSVLCSLCLPILMITPLYSANHSLLLESGTTSSQVGNLGILQPNSIVFRHVYNCLGPGACFFSPGDLGSKGIHARHVSCATAHTHFHFCSYILTESGFTTSSVPA
ncbi:hypothetical protein V8F06_003971 [Rhypophila decipiens]